MACITSVPAEVNVEFTRIVVSHDRPHSAVVHNSGVAAVHHLFEGHLRALELCRFALGLFKLLLKLLHELTGFLKRIQSRIICSSFGGHFGLCAATFTPRTEAVKRIASILCS